MEEGQMNAEQRAESAEGEAATSGAREVPIRESAPLPSRTLEASHRTSTSSHGPEYTRPSSSDVWSGAISRLQTQTSYNTGMLESHRRQVADVEMAVGRLNQEMGSIFSALNELRAELRGRFAANERPRHDAGDLDVLTEQIANVTGKANEIDSLKMQVELMKNRMKRIEEQNAPSGSGRRSATSSTQRDSSFHEPPAHPPPPHLHHGPLPPAHAHPPPHHQPLPPMRTASMVAASDSRPTGLLPRAPPVLQSQHNGEPSRPPPLDQRTFPPDSSSVPASSNSSFRPAEPLPPASSLSGWRPAEPVHSQAGAPSLPPPAAGPGAAQHHPEPEVHSSGWATVNANHGPKRPFDDPRQSPYEPPVTGSPKRPKLAPIMPRSNYSDEQYAHSNYPNVGAADSSHHPHSRVPSDASQPQSQAQHNPASANTPAYRFITSTSHGDTHDPARAEAERALHVHHHHPGHPGSRGGRSRGRGARGRASRGGRGTHPHHVHPHMGAPHEHGPPEWSRPDWTGSRGQPNGYYPPLHPFSPKDVVRADPRHQGGANEREHEHPATPVQPPSHRPTISPANSFAVVGPTGAGLPPGEMGHSASSGKKTRTKPFRNAEGVLIRKDGRPDMRSVSSANNLRKVHAKKEPDHADTEGPTPPSNPSVQGNAAHEGDKETSEDGDLSGTPGSVLENGAEHRNGHEHEDGDGDGEEEMREGEEYEAEEEEEEEEEGDEGDEEEKDDDEAEAESGPPRRDTRARHRQLMSRMFPRGMDGAESKSTPERFFLRHRDEDVEMRDTTAGAEKPNASGHEHGAKDEDTNMDNAPAAEVAVEGKELETGTVRVTRGVKTGA